MNLGSGQKFRDTGTLKDRCRGRGWGEEGLEAESGGDGSGMSGGNLSPGVCLCLSLLLKCSRGALPP